MLRAASTRAISAVRPTSLLRPAIVASARSLATITYSPPIARVGQPAPNFTANAVIDNEITTLSLEQYRGSYTVLLFYPKDFTFVCPTEIIAFSDAAERFKEINAKVVGISCDSEEVHLNWIHTPRKRGGLGHLEIPLVADLTKSIAADYGVLVEELGIALRGLFIIDPNGILQQIIVNNLPVGRSVEETIRLIQAYDFVAKHGEVCPAGWKPGDKSMKANTQDSLEYFGSGATEVNEVPVELSPKIVMAKSTNHLDELIKNKPKAMVFLSASWCGKCRQIQPFVNQLSEQYPDVTFIKVETTEDALTDAVSKLSAPGLPAFFFYKNGQQTLQPVTGYKKTPLKEAVAALTKG